MFQIILTIVIHVTFFLNSFFEDGGGTTAIHIQWASFLPCQDFLKAESFRRVYKVVVAD